MTRFYELPSYSAILTLLDSVLAEINLGLLIYHVEQTDHPESLKLIYANSEASRSTGVELRPRVGKPIGEAFPSLRDTEIPRIFLDVARTRKARRLEAVRYRDDEMRERTYRVRAFPMPMQCVGVIFERGGQPGDPGDR